MIKVKGNVLASAHDDLIGLSPMLVLGCPVMVYSLEVRMVQCIQSE